MRKILIWFPAIVVLIPSVTWALFDDPTISFAEIRGLPPLCIARYKLETGQGAGDPEVAQWGEILGNDMMHVHHYCQGLVHLARAENNYKNQRSLWIHNALGSFEYVLRNVKADSYLLPDIHFNKGEAYLLSKKSSLAAAEFSQVIKLKPDYLRAYAALSDYYLSDKQRDKALKILEAGLKQSPDSKALRRRYQELGGNLAALIPAPSPKKPAEEAAPPLSAPSEEISRHKEEAPAPENAQAPDQPKTGTPTNPWCRFCPPE